MNKIKILFKNIYILVFLISLIVIFLFFILFNKKASPIIMNYANVQTKKVAIEILKNTGLKEVNELIENKELYFIEKNLNGEIESIDFNTIALNEALIIVSKTVRKRLKQVQLGKNLPKEMYKDILDTRLKNGIVYNVPLGILFGNAIFSSSGPKIPVKIEYLGNVGVDVKTKVSEYGVNSALIQAYIYVEVTQRAILPFATKDIKITSQIPIIMKIVKGNIPNYLYNSDNSYSLQAN